MIFILSIIGDSKLAIPTYVRNDRKADKYRYLVNYEGTNVVIKCNEKQTNRELNAIIEKHKVMKTKQIEVKYEEIPSVIFYNANDSKSM